MTDEATHFDQLSPIEGFQVQPDDSVQPIGDGGGAPEMPPPGDSGSDEYAKVAPPVPAELPQELTDAVLEVAVSQRAQLGMPAGNLDVKGAPHFERVIGGTVVDGLLTNTESVCGQCAQPWPCPSWLAIAETGQRDLGPGQTVALPTMAEAAEAAGMDLAAFTERLNAQRRG